MAEHAEKKPVYKKWWFWVIIVVLLVGMAGSSQDSNTVSTSSQTSNEEQVKQTQEKFILQSDTGSTDGFNYYIEGTIKNNTDKQYSYVQVTFNLYDKDGAQLGTAVDNINNLEANGIWKYKAIGLTSEGKDVASYKLTEITGW